MHYHSHFAVCPFVLHFTQEPDIAETIMLEGLKEEVVLRKKLEYWDGEGNEKSTKKKQIIK